MPWASRTFARPLVGPASACSRALRPEEADRSDHPVQARESSQMSGLGRISWLHPSRFSSASMDRPSTALGGSPVPRALPPVPCPRHASVSAGRACAPPRGRRRGLVALGAPGAPGTACREPGAWGDCKRPLKNLLFFLRLVCSPGRRAFPAPGLQFEHRVLDEPLDDQLPKPPGDCKRPL